MNDLDAVARRGDMRIQVVLRELNQGALAGFPSEVTEAAARMVITALDSFDHPAVMLTEEKLEAMYQEWVDSGTYSDECGHYGSQRAAFYAGVAAGTGAP